MPKPIVKYDSDKLLKKMAEYQKVVGKEVGQQVKNFSRVLALDLMRQTFPFGNTAKEKKSGEGAITRDLMRAFRVLATRELAKARAVKAAGGQYVKVAHHPDNKEFWVDVTKDFIEGDLASKHKSLRVNGRVKARGDYGITSVAAFRKYERAVHKMVGYAKAGWAAAAQKMGADTKAAETGRGIPAWIKRHIAMQSPNVQDKTADPKNPRLVFDSSVSFMSEVLPSKSLYASKNITRAKFAKFLQKAIRAELKKAKA